MPVSLIPAFLFYCYTNGITPGPANLCSLSAGALSFSAHFPDLPGDDQVSADQDHIRSLLADPSHQFLIVCAEVFLMKIGDKDDLQR